MWISKTPTMQNSSLDYFYFLKICNLYAKQVEAEAHLSQGKLQLLLQLIYQSYHSERKIQLVWQNFTKKFWLLPLSFYMSSKWYIVRTSIEFNGSKSLPPPKKNNSWSAIFPLNIESQMLHSHLPSAQVEVPL